MPKPVTIDVNVSNIKEVEAMLDRCAQEMQRLRTAAVPGEPSHVTRAQAARMLKVGPARVNALVLEGRLVTELHHGTPMIPAGQVHAYDAGRKKSTP